VTPADTSQNRDTSLAQVSMGTFASGYGWAPTEGEIPCDYVLPTGERCILWKHTLGAHFVP
jgi:hypothetical protein